MLKKDCIRNSGVHKVHICKFFKKVSIKVKKNTNIKNIFYFCIVLKFIKSNYKFSENTL